MLKLTKTGIGLLTRQYRSVLKKCWAINAGVWQTAGNITSRMHNIVSYMLSLLDSLLNIKSTTFDAPTVAGTSIFFRLKNIDVIDEFFAKRLFNKKFATLTAIGLAVATTAAPTEAEALRWCIATAVSDTPLKLVANDGTCPDGYSAFGTQSGSNSVALGYKATASAYSSTALGYYATASGGWSVALGYNANASADSSMALGDSAKASNNGAVALGRNATASGGLSVALGQGAQASAYSSVALGPYAIAWGDYSMAQGWGAYTGYKTDKTAYSANPSTSPENAIAIGRFAGALTNYSIALGYQATAGSGGTPTSQTNAIAIGNSAQASGNYSTALGHYANASAAYSVALGALSVANTENTISVGSSSRKRRIMNVAAGEADNDAVNYAQLKSYVAENAGSSYTAGTGISISSTGVISSTVTDTNTTYSAGTGISISGTNNAIGVKLNSTYLATDDNGNIKAKYADSAGSVAWSNVSGKPTFATVATSGSYNDLIDKPSLGAAAAKNVDTTVTENSDNLITSGGVATALNNYYRKMRFAG